MISIRVVDNIIVGSSSGSGIPVGNIEITPETEAIIRALKNEAQNDGRQRLVEWNNGAPALPIDTRPQITVLVNGSPADSIVGVGETFTLTLAVVPAFTAPIVIPVFERRFLFDFVNGIATKSITVTESKLYSISSDERFKVIAPIEIDAVE